MKQALENQPAGWNPLRPPTWWTVKLLISVRDYLPRKAKPKLGIYLSLGTAFDYWHGADAFLAIEDFFVTIDATTKEFDPEKKADFVFYKNRLYQDWENKCWNMASMLSRPEYEAFHKSRAPKA